MADGDVFVRFWILTRKEMKGSSSCADGSSGTSLKVVNQKH